ncbi:tRNA epoxyqueuosine(34) reductase QueG [Pseudobdellovibrio sp. HCB154]|uniref:tRNA epoxyqueuosine(34) reductase QueG n=1 Tax=Pseudobdellovibrio sp. HCB154 TaxID=3386277 RepID=UPI0039174C99
MVSEPHSTKNLFKDPLDLMRDTELKAHLKAIKLEQNFDLVSATALTKPMTIEFYKNWIAGGQHGDMNYLETHLPTKEDPTILHESLRSAITVGFHYFPAIRPYDLKIPARAALYAQNEDYHFWLKEKLTAAIVYLKEKYPNEHFLQYVDSGPVLERDLAYQAGLGWFGKNTCIIHSQKGSLFFLAEILTSLEVTEKLPPHEDLCKNCTKCIDICPTGALSGDKQLNANKCISYLTIESKTVAPVELRAQIGDWFFGCDMCQTVCPWNQKRLNVLLPDDSKKSQQLVTTLPQEKEQDLEKFFRTILESSNKKIQKMFYGTPMLRSGGFGLKRNAMVVIANRRMTSLKPFVEPYVQDAKLAELARWTLEQLT